MPYYDVGPTGRPKNCQQWALYEPPDESPEATLCHGGRYQGGNYSPCPSRADCQRATYRRQEEKERPFPTLNAARPFRDRVIDEPAASPPEWRLQLPEDYRRNGGVGSRVIGETANASVRPTEWRLRLPAEPPSAAVSLPTRPLTKGAQGYYNSPPAQTGATQQSHYSGGYPTPVIPPNEFPSAMRTWFAAPTPTPVSVGGITPTFLPVGRRDVFGRLVKNAAQGCVGAIGWHVYDFARNIDLFGQE
jgi:hypothetical protein